MATQKNATYKVDNGTDWDEYFFKTIADQVIVRKDMTLGDFFRNGGAINGDIELLAGVLEQTESGFNFRANNGLNLGLKTVSNTGRIGDIVLINTDKEFCLRTSRETPSSALTIGAEDIPFKDIFIAGKSKNINGYNSLPNGMIIQWGVQKDTPSGTSKSFNFPIAFPRFVLAMVCSLNGGTTFNNLGSACNPVSTTQATVIQATGVTRDIAWFAIGY